MLVVSDREKYLIENEIPYFKGRCGTISVTLNDVPDEKFNDYWNFCLKQERMKGKIYISGKITGIEKEAPALFEAAEKKLKIKGYEVVNPMTIPHEHDKSWNSYMKADVKAMCDCDEIFMLANWKDSKGAIIEWNIANFLGLKISYEKA